MQEIIEVGLERLELPEAEGAILVGLKKLRGEGLRSMRELAHLALSAGARPVDVLIQPRRSPDSATYIGSGKLEELKALRLSLDAEIVLFNDELTPVQVSNLVDELECKVLDRSELILDIFAQHATSREGQLQVELAQLSYLLPRLVGKGRMVDRIGAGGGQAGGVGVRGPGETKLETQRRRLRRRIAKLKDELEEVRRHREVEKQGRQRRGLAMVSLVGYTNAGKSTLLNALVGSDEVRTNNRLFETLDTTIRKMEIEGAEVLISDTVGFIYKLPRTLFTAFMATLEQLEDADVILHVLDASQPWVETERRASEEMLKKIGVADRSTIVVVNKWDRIAGTERAEHLKEEMPDALPISALESAGLDELRTRIAQVVFSGLVPLTLRIPYDSMQGLQTCRDNGRVLETRYEGEYVAADVEMKPEMVERLREYVVAPG
ncbi:MAG: GTPase HflX [Armatimonadota bacterium]